LYGLDGKVDIHANNECAFCCSCEHGYLNVAQWLYGLDGKIDIHANNDYVFRVRWESVDVTDWLNGLCEKIDQ